ncbi:MAG: CCA tRNA nucleotidyltransferase [Planctomycetota bacterium]
MRSDTPAEVAGKRVVERLRELGHVAYFAGGCVRDRLLGREPNDVDVATDARPEQVQRAFKRTKAVGAQFGIVLVRLGGEELEVATFRADGTYTDGRRPDSVRFTDPREDALRRDFTINGLFYDPLADEVLDFVDGQTDLRRRVVRAIGDPEARFAEDKLRILRAPRFAAALGFDVAPETAAAIKLHVHDLSQVAPERLWGELLKILSKPTRARGVALCAELGVLGELFPELTDLELPHRTLGSLPVDAPLVATLAGLLAQLDVPAIEGALRRLRASNKEREGALGIAAGVHALPGLLDAPLAEQKRAMAEGAWEHVPDVAHALLVARGEDPAPAEAARALRASYAQDPSPAGLFAPPLLMGADLQRAGLKPGRHFGPILDRVRDAQRRGEVQTPEEALARGLAVAAELGAGGP